MQEQLDNVLSLLLNAIFILYMHWHEASSVQPNPPADMTNLSTQEAQDYRDYLRGPWLTWWIDLLNIMIAANPTVDYTMSPVGPIIMDLWETHPALIGLNSGVFFTDDAPHGSETIHCLASMISYRQAFKQDIDLDGWTMPVGSNVNVAVVNNIDSIMAAITERLDHYHTLFKVY